MASEGKFFLDRENTDANPTLTLDRTITRQDECRFRQIHFASDGLHFGIRETGAIVKYGKRVALEWAGGEDVELGEGEQAR